MHKHPKSALKKAGREQTMCGYILTNTEAQSQRSHFFESERLPNKGHFSRHSAHSISEMNTFVTFTI
jgi:hypothetical protein